jgi:hypothetical protein
MHTLVLPDRHFGVQRVGKDLFVLRTASPALPIHVTITSLAEKAPLPGKGGEPSPRQIAVKSYYGQTLGGSIYPSRGWVNFGERYRFARINILISCGKTYGAVATV